jgi:membrane-associated phospholipid phosphatase
VAHRFFQGQISFSYQTISVFVILETTAVQSRACERMAPWSRLTDTAEQVASPLPLSLIAGSAVPPLLLAPTGADYQLRLISQRDLHGKPNAEPISVWAPFVLPVVVAGVDVFAYASNQCEAVRPASAMLQAMGISLVLVTGLKVIAGRSWPSGGLDPKAPDYLQHPENAHRFSWFSWKNGDAWPSGHTAIMFSAATALSTVELGRSWLGYAAYTASAGVALGMWLGDHHWVSDIVSGGLLGVAIGRSVGLAFRDSAAPDGAANWLIVPYATGTDRGLNFAAVW